MKSSVGPEQISRYLVSHQPLRARTAGLGDKVRLQSKAAYLGTRVSFAVTANGAAPLWFQWRLDGRELLDQTNRTLTLDAVQPADEGDYSAVVTNIAGTAVSDAARLHVVPASTNFNLSNFPNAAGFRLPYFYFLPSNYDLWFLKIHSCRWQK